MVERPGILDKDGMIRDLSGHVSDWTGDNLVADILGRVAAIDIAALPVVPEGTRLGACVARPGKFICIGLNYNCNAKSLGQPIPDEPVIAMKPLSAICGANDGIELPRGSTTTDWEVELGIVIGKSAKYIDERNAREHIAGYCLINDIADRELQSKRGGDTSKGRGMTVSALSVPISYPPRTSSIHNPSISGWKSMGSASRAATRPT